MVIKSCALYLENYVDKIKCFKIMLIKLSVLIRKKIFKIK
jgi:hypothetical protein